MFKISQRITKLPVSSVRRLSSYAKEAKEKGVKIYHLNIGDPDIKTPKEMLDVLKNWDMETIRYADSVGEFKLLVALKTYYHNLGFKKIQEEDMVVTVGGSEAVNMSFLLSCDPLDEILVFEPFYSNYASSAHICNVRLVAVPTSTKDGFHLPNKKMIESKITKKTKAILICSPNNPTGAVYSYEELKMLVSIAKKRGLFLISDEVYREFVFDNKKYTSILSFLEEIPNQIILLDSLSKRFSLCGARIGILASLNKDIISGAIKLAQSRLSAPLIEEILASKLTEIKKSYTQKIIKEYQSRRDLIYQNLMKIPGVFLSKPEGAFYIIVNLPVKDAENFAIFLLRDFRINNETVMLAPGNGFYQTLGQGENQVRIAYVLNRNDLLKSIYIIKEGLSAYQKLENS